MKHLLLTTIAAVILVGCTTTKHPEPSTVKAPDISIHEAAYRQVTSKSVKYHLAAGTDVNVNAARGWTPLHSVAIKEIAELLITKGADVNAKDKIGGTPLHLAAHSGQREIVELLIANGANMNAKIEVGKWKDQTSLSMAIQNNQTETADLLRKHGGKTDEELQPPSQLLPIPDKLVVLTFDDGNRSDFASVPRSSRSTDLEQPSMSPRDWAFSRTRRTISPGSRFGNSTRWAMRLETTPSITATSVT